MDAEVGRCMLVGRDLEGKRMLNRYRRHVLFSGVLG
jgi:hypothetical protein